MKATLKQNTAIDRQLWLRFLSTSPQAALYVHPAYLDLVAPSWQAIEVWQDNTLIALMPLDVKAKSGFTYALQPAFCQYWGICFCAKDFSSDYKYFSYQRKVVKAVVDAIPSSINWFLYGFAPEFDYPHPFHWAGYELKTRYTYRLDLSDGFETIEKRFGNDTKYDIRKALGAEAIVQEIADKNCISRLIARNVVSGKQLLKAEELATFDLLVPFLLENRMGFALDVRDQTGELLGAGLFGSFAGKTVYLMSAQAPENKTAGAMSLLLSKAIEKATTLGHIFDFEGSMLEGIEGFFRGFGGRPVPYLMIEKNELPLFVRWIRKLL